MGKVYHFALYAWLFLMMVTPEISSKLKLLALIIAFFLAFAYRKCFSVDRRILVGAMIWEMFFTFFMINGLSRGFEFSGTLFEIYLLRPIILTVMSASIRNKGTLLNITKVLVFILVCVEIYNLLYMLGALGILPVFSAEENQPIIVNSDFLSIRTSSQTSLMFLAPFVTTLFFNRKTLKKGFRRIVTIAFLLCALVTAISGRRALQIIFLLIFGMNYLYGILKSNSSNAIQWKIFCLSVVAVVGLASCFLIYRLTGLNIIGTVYSTIIDAFDPNARSSIIRNMQLKYLVDAWTQKPLFGWGLSAYVREYIDWKGQFTGQFTGITVKDGWSYEFFYVALLFQIGIVGVSLIAVVVFSIYRSILIMYKKNKGSDFGAATLAIMAGVLGFFITGATNQMITSSWMWFVFLSTYHVSLKTNNVVDGSGGGHG